MYVNEKRKAVFICHPRTASSALGWVFRSYPLGFVKVGNHHSLNPKMLGGMTVACVVRNPLDMLVSWYYYHRNDWDGKPFQDFLHWFAENPNVWVKHGILYGVPYANHILRYEHLDSDLEAFWKKIGMDPVPLPVRNVSKKREGRPFHEFYSGVTVPDIKLMEPVQENEIPV